MPAYVLYRPDGSLAQVCQCDDPTWDHIQGMSNPHPGLEVARINEYPDDVWGFLANHYVSSAGNLATKATITPAVSKDSIAADGADTATISGLPVPCFVSVSGVLSFDPVTVLDGEVELTSDHPGDLVVNVRAEPGYLPLSLTIHAA